MGGHPRAKPPALLGKAPRAIGDSCLFIFLTDLKEWLFGLYPAHHPDSSDT
jgi:hypothetical protein